jgi:hypothetical protein
MSEELVDATAALFAPLKAKFIPAFDPKHLKRPPIKFLALVVAGVSKKTGFAGGLFTDDQLKGNLPERDDKLNFFTDLIAYTEVVLGEKTDVDPKAIAAGKEVDKTLLFLQAILRSAENPRVPFDAALAQVKGDGAPPPARPPPRKAAPKADDESAAPAKSPSKKAAAKPAADDAAPAAAKPPGRKGAAKPAAEDAAAAPSKPPGKKAAEDSRPPEDKPAANPAGKKAGKSPAKAAAAPEDEATPPTEEERPKPAGKKKAAPPPANDAKPAAGEKPQHAGKTKVDEAAAPPADEDGGSRAPKKKAPAKKKAAAAAADAHTDGDAEPSKVARKPPPKPKEEASVVVDVVAPPIIQEAVVDNEADDIFVEEDNRGAQVGGEEGGRLVKSILDVVRQMGTEAPKGGDDDRFRQGIEIARNLLQLLAKSAQPLDTLIQFSQEDLGNMENEYKRWTAECEKQQKKLEEERLITEQKLAELRGKVEELDKEIVHQQTKLRAIKAAAFLKEHDLMKQFAASCGGQ